MGKAERSESYPCRHARNETAPLALPPVRPAAPPRALLNGAPIIVLIKLFIKTITVKVRPSAN